MYRSQGGSWGEGARARRCLWAALALIGAALMLTSISPTTPTWYLLGAYFLFGLGAGLVNPPITNTAVAGMSSAQAGVASAVASTTRQVGMTLGVAVISAIAGSSISGSIGKGFAAATHPAWWVLAALGVAILILGILTTTEWARGTARETANRFRESRGTGYTQHELAPG